MVSLEDDYKLQNCGNVYLYAVSDDPVRKKKKKKIDGYHSPEI